MRLVLIGNTGAVLMTLKENDWMLSHYYLMMIGHFYCNEEKIREEKRREEADKCVDIFTHKEEQLQS